MGTPVRFPFWLPQQTSCVNHWVLTSHSPKKTQSPRSLLTCHFTCLLHMPVLAAPRDPSTHRKSWEEWKGQAHPHSRARSQLSHSSGMNTDMYIDRPVSYSSAPANRHMAAWKPGTPPHWEAFCLLNCSPSWEWKPPFIQPTFLDKGGGETRGLKENAETSLDHLDAEETPARTWLWGLLTATVHNGPNGHTLSGRVPEQLFGRLVWSYHPSLRDGLPNPGKLGVEVNLMLSH